MFRSARQKEVVARLYSARPFPHSRSRQAPATSSGPTISGNADLHSPREVRTGSRGLRAPCRTRWGVGFVSSIRGRSGAVRAPPTFLVVGDRGPERSASPNSWASQAISSRCERGRATPQPRAVHLRPAYGAAGARGCPARRPGRQHPWTGGRSNPRVCGFTGGVHAEARGLVVPGHRAGRWCLNRTIRSTSPSKRSDRSWATTPPRSPADTTQRS